MTETIPDPAPPGAIHDFDRLVGRWRVRHRQLVGRLVGSTTWREFEGQSAFQLLMGGHANLDDNLLDLPEGPYRALTLRLFDAERRAWSIYWVDGRGNTIDPPMVGGFEADRGIFYGEDLNAGRTVRARFLWHIDGPDRARWEQALSPDGGATWETNWRMAFERMA